jgi:hypothetical protein
MKAPRSGRLFQPNARRWANRYIPVAFGLKGQFKNRHNIH